MTVRRALRPRAPPGPRPRPWVIPKLTLSGALQYPPSPCLSGVHRVRLSLCPHSPHFSLPSTPSDSPPRVSSTLNPRPCRPAHRAFPHRFPTGEIGNYHYGHGHPMKVRRGSLPAPAAYPAPLHPTHTPAPLPMQPLCCCALPPGAPRCTACSHRVTQLVFCSSMALYPSRLKWVEEIPCDRCRGITRMTKTRMIRSARIGNCCQ